LLLEKIGLADEDLPEQYDRSGWPKIRERFAEVFRTKTRDEWCAILEGTDACFAPVLTFTEARSYEHNVAREAFVEGTNDVAVAPRLSRTPGDPTRPSPAWPGVDTDAVLAEFGLSADQIAELRAYRAVR